MLNGNQKPSKGLLSLLAMIPGPAALIAIILVLLFVVDTWFWNVPRTAELTVWGVCFLIFLYWLITGSRK
jgi:hypothetical protein